MSESAFAKQKAVTLCIMKKLSITLYHVVPTLKGLVDIYATTAIKLRISKGDAVPLITVRRKKELIGCHFVLI